ncbi:hypothetical protein ACAG24_009865 [Mycobacterium sp. pW049]|uniref:hypothetical protein n=1 Tax=[Mycobacterium] bulgaricum TaxID=3238985 RepID=UPI00351B26D8
MDLNRFRRFVSVVSVGAVFSCGCSSTAAPEHETATHGPTAGYVTGTAAAVVERLERDGLDLLQPIDTTSADCVSAPCDQAITTDRFRIMSFATTGDAQRFAADHALEQIGSLVVDFSPTLTPGERDALWHSITENAGA